MSTPTMTATAGPGIWIETSTTQHDATGLAAFSRWLDRLELPHRVMSEFGADTASTQWRSLVPTTSGGAPARDTTVEILGRMLAGPVAFRFPSVAELQAHVDMRLAIVEAARRTELSFSTDAADRPPRLWVERDEGFAIAPGVDLLDALRAATQPDGDGRRYGFSCYRASEYAMLTGIAQVMKRHNPRLYARLNQQSQLSVIKSRAFHETFLVEYGETEALPHDYYVPGDRVWFKNPDEASADVPGYEGSWTIYLGGGRFANFWKRDAPYTLEGKCLEIFHWRHAVETSTDGQPSMNETRVAELCERSQGNAAELQTILTQTLRLRDPSGVYASGGCIDRTREYPRWVMPQTCNMPL